MIKEKKRYEGVFETSDLGDIANIYEAENSIAIWKRKPIREIEAELKRIQQDPILIKEIITLETIHHSEIFDHLEGLGFYSLPRDIFQLLQIYSDLFGSTKMGLRFAVIDTALCPKFHTDFVGVRLLCTYSGKGTEYVAGTVENRSILRNQVLRNTIEVFPDRQRVSRYDVILLKGEYFPGNEGSGAIHRSPLVKGRSRVFISIEAVN